MSRGVAALGARVAAAALLLLFAAGACREPEGVSRENVRVVSLSPSTTEAMFAIGAGALLVGRTRQCDYPPAAAQVAVVGDYAQPVLERLLALSPTLVIGEANAGSATLGEQLRAVGIEAWFPPAGSTAEVGAMLTELGSRLGHKREGEGAREAMNVALARIAEWAKAREGVRVVMVLDTRPLFVVGPGSFLDEMLRLAGGTNAIDSGGPFPTIDVERLLALDPDVVIDASAMGDGGVSELASAPSFSRLRAVKEGRVRRLASAAALRPGPRLASGLEDLTQALHGLAPPRDPGPNAPARLPTESSAAPPP